jgi:hypothetical protein
MAAVTFDTLKFANRLKQAGVPAPQAEAEAEVLAEALAVNLKDLTTKADLEAVADRLAHEIREGDAALRADIALLKWMLGLLLGGVAALILKTFF